MKLSKLQKLYIMALKNEAISNKITARSLHRLECGDLEDIGDALVSGYEIEFLDDIDGKWGVIFNCYFETDRELYRIKGRKLSVNGVEINAPYLKMPDHGTEYWHPRLEHDLCVAPSIVIGSEVDKNILRRMVMFKTKKDCSDFVRALGWADE
jgi:hypothetical protein